MRKRCEKSGSAKCKVSTFDPGTAKWVARGAVGAVGATAVAVAFKEIQKEANELYEDSIMRGML